MNFYFEGMHKAYSFKKPKKDLFETLDDHISHETNYEDLDIFVEKCRRRDEEGIDKKPILYVSSPTPISQEVYDKYSKDFIVFERPKCVKSKDSVKNEPVFNLAKAVIALSMADRVLFLEGWEQNKECWMEYQICFLYGIKILK